MLCFCKAGLLGYGMAFNTGKVMDFPGSFLILHFNHSRVKERQGKNTETEAHTHKRMLF